MSLLLIRVTTGVCARSSRKDVSKEEKVNLLQASAWKEKKLSKNIKEPSLEGIVNKLTSVALTLP